MLCDWSDKILVLAVGGLFFRKQYRLDDRTQSSTFTWGFGSTKIAALSRWQNCTSKTEHTHVPTPVREASHPTATTFPKVKN